MERLPVATPKDVADFQTLCLRRYGVSLTFGEAREAMPQLMQFFYVTDKAAENGSHDAEGD